MAPHIASRSAVRSLSTSDPSARSSACSCARHASLHACCVRENSMLTSIVSSSVKPEAISMRSWGTSMATSGGPCLMARRNRDAVSPTAGSIVRNANRPAGRRSSAHALNTESLSCSQHSLSVCTMASNDLPRSGNASPLAATKRTSWSSGGPRPERRRQPPRIRTRLRSTAQANRGPCRCRGHVRPGRLPAEQPGRRPALVWCSRWRRNRCRSLHARPPRTRRRRGDTTRETFACCPAPLSTPRLEAPANRDGLDRSGSHIRLVHRLSPPVCAATTPGRGRSGSRSRRSRVDSIRGVRVGFDRPDRWPGP